MKISIIPSDKTVVVDGRGFKISDVSFIDPSIHAIQWKDTKGHIEFVEDENGLKPLNQSIDDFSPYQPAFDQWQVEKDKYDAMFIPSEVI
jgi:hypothetical protein